MDSGLQEAASMEWGTLALIGILVLLFVIRAKGGG
jgi:hypothetical protein